MAGKGAYNSRCVQLLGIDPTDDENWPLEVDETKEGVDPNKIWPLKVDWKNECFFEGNFVSS